MANNGYAEWRKNKAKQVSEGYREYALKRRAQEYPRLYNDWIGRVNASRDKYIEDAKSRADVYQPSNLFTSYADTTDAEIKALAQEGQKYREHFLKYGDLYGADMANKIRSGVDDVDSYLHDLSVGLGAERRYWEGFTDLEDFNTKRAAAEAAKKEAEEYAANKEKYKAYDFAAGEEKATYLKGIAERLADIASKERGDGNTLVGGGLPTFRERRETADRERQVVYQELRSRYPELADYDLTELNNYIAQLGDEIEGGKSFLELDKFSNYGNPRSEYYDPNFEQYAKYDPSRLDRISYLNDGFNESYDPYAIAYHYINSSEDVKHDIMNRYANANGGDTNINVIQMRDWLVDLNNMSEEQKKNFNYLYSYTPRYAIPKGGEKRRVERYTEYILPEIENIAEYKFGKDHPFLASLLSMAYTPLSGVEVVADTAKFLGNVLIDPNNAKMDSNSFAGDKGILGQGVSDTVDWNIGGWDAFDFLYNTGMSGVDSAVASFIPGGYMLLGLSEAANGVNDGLERGMSDGQALANGVFRGIFEALFEKISIGNLDSMKSLKPKTLKQFGKEMVKSMGVNASEEALTEIANITYDIIANGELSQLQQLVGSGKSYLEAIGELGLQVLESGASGALMGFGFSGAASVVNSAVNTFKQNNIGKGIVADGKAQDYISRGLELPGTKAFKYAESAKAKLDKGKKANVRIGKLAQNLSDSQMISSFRSQLGEKSGDIAETLTDLVKGREVSNKAVRSILQNETALSMLNESFGTSFTADSKVEDVNEGIKKGFETPKTERDKIVDTLKKNVDSKGVNAYADTIEALQRGEVVSDKEINAFLKNPQALAALNEITGEAFTKKSTTNTVRKAMVKDNMSRSGQALMFGTTLDIGANGLKGLVSVANHSSGSMANIAQAYNAIYQAAKQGKAITDAKNPYLAELNAAQKLIAYEYGVMDSLEKKAEEEKLETSWTKEETENKADKKVDEAVDDTVPEGGEKLKTGEVVVPVKEMTKEQSDLVEAGKKLGIEVIVASIKKQGKNIDGLYNGKALYVNPDPTSGNPLVTILKHELTHFLEKNTKYSTFATAVTDSKAFHKWLKDKGFKNTQEYLAEIVRNYKLVGKNYAETDPEPHGEMIANFVGDVLFAEDNSLERFVNELTEEKKKTFGDFIRDFINWIKGIFGKTDEVRMLEKKYAELFGSAKEFSAGEYIKETKDTQYNFALAESHRDMLAEKYTSSAAVDLETIRARYDKILEIWKRIGGQLDSKFLKEWDSKVGKDRAFTVFKAQSGYKYNVELSSMCKKGVPLFEAIDTIVKEEAMKELKVDKLGKAEKEILYDLLKSDGFDIPCAICYVEQARQREGVIIDAFLNGSEDGKVGWNQVLRECEEKMRAAGVDYKFPTLDRSVATDKYVARKLTMTETEQNAFYEALKGIANREIKKYNDSHQSDKKFKPRKLVTSLTPDAIADCFKGNISSDLKIFKVLFQAPDSRFTVDKDLLYASTTTHNLAYSHQALYSLFNQQGGVSGYKTKQGNVVYWGDILEKKWEASKLRKEGGIRYQSNSDSQMYTLLDQVQMFIDLTAKGYYLQSYSKVLSYLKLLGLSKGKINASLIPKVVVYRNTDSSVDFAKTQENAGLDENGKPIYDDIEGIDHKEAFMLIEDPDYSRSVGGVCIGYSDNHIRALLDDSRIQLIIGFHDKTNNPDKRYRGARYAKNYNGINEAVDSEGKTVHIGFNQFVQQAEKMFTKSGEDFTGTATYNGKEYKANDIPRLAADLYLEMCAKKGYKPAYNIEGIVGHPNYYKLLADFSLYDSKGNYAPHQKVEYNMPDQVPYLDENGHKRWMKSETYIRNELEKELKVRDDIAEKLADKSEAGLIPRFIKAVNGERVADGSNTIEDDTQYSYTPTKEESEDYAERSVIASFLGKKSDSVREIVLNFVHDGVYDARNQGRDNWGEYSWTINSHAYGPYAELSIYNNLSGNVLVKNASIDKRNDVTSKISSYIIDDALKIIRDYPNVKIVKKEKPNPNSIPKNVTTSKISNAVPSTNVTDKIPKSRPQKSIDTKAERNAALDDPISNARLTEEDATTTPDIKRKTGKVKGDGERDTVISKGRADIFSEEFKKEVETDDFIQKYKTITNEETLRTAADELDREGNEGVQNWLALKPERASVVDIVKGFILLDRYRRLGHIEGQVRVAQKISDMGTAAGQAVQSFTILRRLDAAAMLAYSQRSLDNALKAMSKARGEIWLKKHADRFKLNDEDIDFILNRSILATTLPDGRDKDILISQIAQRIQDKLPPEKGDSAKALQRISMLFNPKTIIRNVAGNVSVAPVHYVSDWIGTAADALIGKKTGVRTTSVFTPVGENAKAFARGAYESFDDFRKKVNTQANLDRFDVRSAHGKAFDEHGKARRLAQALNAMDRLTSFALAVGDRPFYEYWFTRSINAQKRANKVDVPTAEMIEIATQEALQRTWQDDNGFTKFVGNLKRVLNTVNVKGYGLGDVLIKFTKTPANIAKAIYDLSPVAAISVTKNAVALNRAIKSGKDVAVAQKTFVKSFSNAVAGTMLYALMIALFNAGLLTGGSDDDKDVAAFEKWVQGVPSYSINLGGRWFSYEWMQPIGAAAAIVSDFMEAKEVGTGAWDSIVLALKSGGNVFTNQSFLQSFQRLFSADTLWDGVLDTLLSDPSAWVPQILSQFANLFDDKRRVTYDKASPLRTFYNSFAYKIPGLRNTLTEDVDVFGRTIPNSQANIGNAFFNPANTYVDTSDDVTSHVYELYKALGDKAMIPAKAPYSITVGKESIPLTAEERAEYQRIMGGVSYHIIEQLIKSDFYNSYTDDEKDTVIRAVYSYASKVAQASYKADYTYDMALKDNIYMTRAIYDAMSDEDKQQAYYNGVMKSYAEILNTDEKGLVTFFELKGVKDAVLNATIEYDSAKAIELMKTAIEKSSAYADKEEEEKAIRSGIRSTLTSYWKPHYKVANYENDREEMDRILNVLYETGLYGNRYETRRTIQKWLEEEE